MLIPQAMAATIVQSLVPATSTPEQRAMALATWIKICSALVPYLQANIMITVPPITSIVTGSAGPIPVVGTGTPPAPTIIMGVQ